MKFVSIRDFRMKAKEVRENLEKEKEIVLTASGQPFAILSHVTPERLEEELMALRRAKIRRAINTIRMDSKKRGLDRLSWEEIDRIIQRARRGKRSRAKTAP